MDFLPDTYGERHDSERPKASNLSAWRIGTEPWGASRACTKMRPMANGQSSRSTCSIKACRTRKGQIAGISRDLPFICPFGGPQAAVKTIGRADHRGFPGFALYLPFRRSSSCRKDHQKGRSPGFPRICPFGGRTKSGINPSHKKSSVIRRSFFDVSDKIRTRDLLVRSQTLYPAELHLHSNNILYNEVGFVNNKLQ